MWNLANRVNRFLKALTQGYEKFEEVYNSNTTINSTNNTNTDKKDDTKRTEK